MYGAMAALAALQDRQQAGWVKVVDVALSEAVLSLMEGCLPEYGLLGKVREPTGATLPTDAPSNAYPTRDGSWILIAANSDPLFARLTDLMDMPELAMDTRFIGNSARVNHAAPLDAIIAGWTLRHDAAALIAELEDANIPATKIYTIEDCANDPQFQVRGMVERVTDP